MVLLHTTWAYAYSPSTPHETVAVYIPPRTNAKEALNELFDAISEQQTSHPHAF